jgi:hypothetical protein
MTGSRFPTRPGRARVVHHLRDRQPLSPRSRQLAQRAWLPDDPRQSVLLRHGPRHDRELLLRRVRDRKDRRKRLRDLYEMGNIERAEYKAKCAEIRAPTAPQPTTPPLVEAARLKIRERRESNPDFQPRSASRSVSGSALGTTTQGCREPALPAAPSTATRSATPSSHGNHPRLRRGLARRGGDEAGRSRSLRPGEPETPERGDQGDADGHCDLGDVADVSDRPGDSCRQHGGGLPAVPETS